MVESALKGTTWYWREGLMVAPIGSGLGGLKDKELCLPVVKGIDLDKIQEELSNQGINMHTKEIHSGFLIFRWEQKSSMPECQQGTRNIRPCIRKIWPNCKNIFWKTAEKLRRIR